MGEVYRARDTVLGREVAVKVLPDSFADEPRRVARLEREAKTLAALNHPNVAHLYGLEHTDGRRALVMELVPGETIADRLARGPLPLAEALPIAVQVVRALEAAHDRNIVHRDLKPANIKVRPDGTVKVLDFGLAKSTESDGSAPAGSNAPTLTVTNLTHKTIVGTPAYMSPEQTQSTAVDERADIWSFGTVLYEMLAGRPAFSGTTAADTMLAVLTHEPDWQALPRTTPSVHRVLRRCLAKEPSKRLRAAADVRLELEEVGASDDEGHGRRWLGWTAVLVTSLAAVVIAALLVRRAVPASATSQVPATVRFSIDAPEGTTIANEHYAVSPDGRTVAFVTVGDGRREGSLWIRPLDSMSARQLPGTDGAYFPFWSPDGRSMGFFAHGQLKRIELTGGPPQVLANTPAVALGGAWNADGTIVFSARSVINRIAAAGGPVTPVVALNRENQEDSLRFPRFLPDGRRFLYVARSGRAAGHAVYVADLNGRSMRLLRASSQVEYVPPGYLLSVANETLVARRFNPETLALDTDTVTLAADVGTLPSSLAGFFASSRGGTLAYQRRASESKRLHWLDRSGRPVAAGPSTDGLFAQVRLRPDGRQAAISFDEDGDGSNSIWMLRSDGSTPTRLTFAGTHDRDPVWSPDGRRVAFSSSRSGSYALFIKPATGSRREALAIRTDDDLWAEDWSPDGRFIAIRRGRATTSTDVIVMPLENTRTPIVVAESTFSEHGARFSPDGRWMAYVSEETGRPEVYVQPFPPSGARWQISTDGGEDPAWGKDGRELLYIRPDGMLAATPVESTGSTVSTGPTRPLFTVGRSGGVAGNRFDVSRDGQTLIASVESTPPRPQPLMIVLNWQADLARTSAATR
jgi:Tol biopolymer transport system component